LLSTLPVGRRFAVDVQRRRLWIVCGACRRWSSYVAYTPPEVLSDLFTECDLHHRDAPRRLWTVNVSLARHVSGVELIRVGRAARAELAAWRYGAVLEASGWRHANDLLGERAGEWLAARRDRLRDLVPDHSKGALEAVPYLLGGLVVGTLSNTALAQATALCLVMLAFFKLFTERSTAHERHVGHLSARSHVVLGRIAEIGGSSFLLHADQAWRMRLSSAPGAGRLRLVVPARRPRRGSSAPAHEVEGPEALRALRPRSAVKR
jgi:hypothetical protein